MIGERMGGLEEEGEADDRVGGPRLDLERMGGMEESVSEP